MSLSTSTNKILIVGLIPYFLEKPVLWFEKNFKKILRIRKTQSFFEQNTIFLEKNQVIKISQLLRKLDEMGYEKVQKIGEPGEFSRRGGIIDVFPINLKFAVRLDFYGNRIENIERLPIKIDNEQYFKKRLKRKLRHQKIYSDLKGLKFGDYLVHLDHGIGKFAGFLFQPIFSMAHDRTLLKRRYYVLEYAQGDKLYVPIGLERKLSRYVGFVEPTISRLSSPLWKKTKKKVKEEAIKLARELLEIYAKRKISIRPPYLPNQELDFTLKASFPYQETPDQIQVIEEIKKDLEKKQTPMDRIVCGDVGFGKTEIALRIAIKATNSGRQVAMICPTTILANQHFLNFKERLKNFPINLALLSRLQSKKEQKKIIKDLKEGKIDLIIGTHRILSSDVAPFLFQREGVGLLIIDDEHRFGVRQKEKLKKIRPALDVLSLSATPIPRTLYLALSNLKEISLIRTPPLHRIPIKTFVLPWSEKIIKRAIIREITRGGQVYYLHNRIETIQTAKKFLESLMSNVKHQIKIGIAHGRLPEKELVKVMTDFQNKKIDLLIATTIIEAGLDLPNVNTLIVADATKLGLSEAHQIRGRIGRSHIQAFAYFFYGQNLSKKAKLRLDALKEAQELGAGYKIALKDLEIRGAGNILGKEQSGNINKVGLNLYCQMLAEAIEKLKRS